MNAKELRVGNFVKYSKDNISPKPDIIKVESIGESGINLEVEYGILIPCYRYDDIEGIVLTKEWVLKLGFIEAWDGAIDIFCSNPKNIEYGRLDLKPIVRIESNGFSYGDISCCEIAYWKEIKYVHQLQNLHYFNTGEEI